MLRLSCFAHNAHLCYPFPLPRVGGGGGKLCWVGAEWPHFLRSCEMSRLRVAHLDHSLLCMLAVWSVNSASTCVCCVCGQTAGLVVMRRQPDDIWMAPTVTHYRGHFQTVVHVQAISLKACALVAVPGHELSNQTQAMPITVETLILNEVWIFKLCFNYLNSNAGNLICL